MACDGWLICIEAAPQRRYGTKMKLRTYTGAAIAPHLDVLADLRIAVFREWPYLYAGDRDYEAKYLATYASSPESLFALAFDEGRVIGASTGVPLAHEPEAFQRPFRERGLDIGHVFYFGESVLLREYRGRGLGHRFFDVREDHARRLGHFGLTAFCAVERDPLDSRRPAEYRDNDPFWVKRGYVRQSDMFCTLDWQEIGCDTAEPHRLRFWLRSLELVA